MIRLFSHAMVVCIIAQICSSVPANSQRMMDHVDLSSPQMSESEHTRAEIEEMIGNGGPVDLRNKSLNGLDLSGLDLTGADFGWARLNNANLSGALLNHANFDLAWAIDANFDDASLKSATLNQTQLLRASLRGADLSHSRITADMSMTDLQGARFHEANMAADMRNQSMGLMRVVLRSAKLQGADLSFAQLSRADMEFAKLNEANLSNADLTRAKLGGANLTGAVVRNTVVSETDFDSSTLKELQGLDEMIGLATARNVNRAYKDW